MARCTFREILTSYTNQIMAQLAGSAGFLPECAHPQSPGCPVGPDQTGASNQCETVQADSGPAFNFAHCAPNARCVAILRKISVTTV